MKTCILTFSAIGILFLASSCKDLNKETSKTKSTEALKTGDASQRGLSQNCANGNMDEALPQFYRSMINQKMMVITTVNKADLEASCREVWDEAKTELKDGIESGSEFVFKGCWKPKTVNVSELPKEVVGESATGTRDVPEVFVLDSAVNDALLPMMTYAFYEGFVTNFRFKVEGNYKVILDKLDQRELLTKTALAEVKDAATKARYEKMLSNPKLKGSVENFFMAESVDSWYCSQETRNKYEAAFPNAAKLFGETVALLGTPHYDPSYQK
jgi:hypothetical protein